jgi:amino-acid N-acetyltransferase
MTLIIRPATPVDLNAAVELLQGAGLPVADLSAERLALIAETDEIIQGVIGLELFGKTALLRSLAVASGARGAGIGPALVTALETSCMTDGVKELWLLTIDADAFFLKLGYETRERSEAPEAIRNTEEFRGLCPGDAVLMSKNIRGKSLS